MTTRRRSPLPGARWRSTPGAPAACRRAPGRPRGAARACAAAFGALLVCAASGLAPVGVLAVLHATHGASRDGTDPEAPGAADAGPPRTVSAWLPYWNQHSAYRDALRHADQLHTVSPFWYEAKADGAVAGYPGAGERTVVDGLHGAGIKVVPTVMDRLAPGELAAVLTSADDRARHVAALLAVARTRAYDGIDIDYESIAATGDEAYAGVRDAYTAFVTDLCHRLHALRKQCVVTLTPKTTGTGRVWDYRRLGAVADRVRIMAYNLHWGLSEPGPLSSPGWYDEILRRATAEVPPDKLETGLPAYGWNWTEGAESAVGVTTLEAQALRRRVRAPYALDAASGTPHFTYRDDTGRHTVWYQDAGGVGRHLPVLRRHGVRATAVWALGFEDQRLWRVLARGATATTADRGDPPASEAASTPGATGRTRR